MKTTLHVMPRDIQALALLYQLHLATTEQMRAAIYGNRNVAQRRMQGMEKLGLLSHLGITLENRGQPTKVYFLNRRKRSAIKNLLNQDISIRNLERGISHVESDLRHQLGMNSILATFYGSADDRKLGFRFIAEYQKLETADRNVHATEDSVQDPMSKGRRAEFRRDAIFTLSTKRGTALFELEYDRGTEVIRSPGRRAVTLHRKIALFLQSIKEKRFKRYSRPEFFGTTFNISRLLIVTTSEERIERIHNSISDLDTRGIVMASWADRIESEGPLSNVWMKIGAKESLDPISLIANEN